MLKGLYQAKIKKVLAEVVVKWSTYSPSDPTIRVQFTLKSIVFIL